MNEMNYDAELEIISIELYGNSVLVNGYIYGDIKHRWEDGTLVNTSAVKVIDLEIGYIKTRNTMYKIRKKQ